MMTTVTRKKVPVPRWDRWVLRGVTPGPSNKKSYCISIRYREYVSCL